MKRDNYFDYQADRDPNTIFQLTEYSFAIMAAQLSESLGEDTWSQVVIRREGEYIHLHMNLTEDQVHHMQAAIRLVKQYSGKMN